MERIRLAAALVLAGAGPVLAQVPVENAFQANTYVSGYQFFASPVIGPRGAFGVVWSSNPQDGSDNGVYGQRYTRDGALAGGEFQVNTYTTGSQGGPHSTVLANGDLVVVYHDRPRASVLARRYQPLAGPRGPEFQVNTVPAPDGLPVVGGDAAGGFIIAWSRADGSNQGVFARRYDRAGEAVGDEFQVNTYTTGFQGGPSVATSTGGDFALVWTSVGTQDGSEAGVFGQRFNAAGARLGGEFQVNSYTTGYQSAPAAAMDRQGRMVVVWHSRGQDGSGWGVFGRRFDAAGAPVGADFQVNTYTTGFQTTPTVAADESGNFVVIWEHFDFLEMLRGRRFDAQAVPRSAEFAITPTPDTDDQLQSVVVSDRVGNFIVAWYEVLSFDVFARRFGWILPAGLSIDAVAQQGSNGNRVLEPCETVFVDPAWSNFSRATQTLSGQAASFTGPPGATYQLVDGSSDYGTVGNGATSSCRSNGNCYTVSVACTASRPAVHWDAILSEQLAPAAQGQTSEWRIHVGESFADVPSTSPYYGSIETLLHNGGIAGCDATSYCPSAPTTREQMAVFMLVGKDGATIAPPACGAPTRFSDVPASSPFCRWIEELSRRGVVGGCGSGLYCPQAAVTREQMAVFVLRTAVPLLNPPGCTAGSEMFADVPASSPYCRWIEELVRRGVTAGCGNGNYCPTALVTREQMAVFIVFTFGLGWFIG